MKSLCALMVGLSIAAHGQTVHPIAPHKGAWTLGFSIDWFRNSSGGTATSVFLTPGYFVSDQLEVRVPLSYDRLFGISETIYGVGTRYHFGHRSRLDPFVGALVEHAGAPRFREDLIGAQGGVHYFLTHDVAVSAILTLARDRMNGATQTTAHLTSGMSVFFAGF